MSLQVWLPLNGNLNNQGLSNIRITNNGAIIDNNGKIGKCYYFSGSDVRLKIPNPIVNGISEFSLCCWFYVNNNLSKWALFGARSSGSGKGILCHMNKVNNQILFDDGARFTLSYDLTNLIEKWNHITLIKTSTQKKIYLNGELIGTQDTTATTNDIRNELTIGNDTYETYTDNGLVGKMNDVRVYDHALSDKEVEEIAKGLILHYKLDDISFTNSNLISNFDTSFLSYNDGTTTLLSNQMNNGTQEIISNFNGAKKCLHLHSSGGNNRQYQTISVTSGKAYMVSLDYYSTISQSPAFRGELNGGNYSWTGSSSINYTIPNKWQRLSFTYTSLTSNATLYYFIMCANGTDCYVKNIKVEEGDLSTPWIPNESSYLYSVYKNNNILYDLSGYNNNGTVNGDISTVIDTLRYNTAIYFPSGTGIFAHPNIILSTFTIAFWGKHTATGKMLMGSNASPSSTNTNWYWYGDNSFKYPSGEFYYAHNAGSADSLLNKWTHFVATYDGANITIYRNGINEGSKALTGTQTLNYLSVGNGYSQSSYWENGYVSDFRLYTTALTADQVKDLYEDAHMLDNKGNLYTRELVE